jgi:hypothetical protein
VGGNQPTAARIESQPTLPAPKSEVEQVPPTTSMIIGRAESASRKSIRQSLPPAFQTMLKEIEAEFGPQALARRDEWTLTEALEDEGHLGRVLDYANQNPYWRGRLIKTGSEEYVFANFCQCARKIAQDYGRDKNTGRYKPQEGSYAVN